MGLAELMWNRAMEIREIKRNPNLNALNQLRQLYPDQEIADQNLLKGIEQEQQRVNPAFRMPREERKSPFQTQLAPGEASPVSEAMVQQYVWDAPIRSIRPAKPGKELWTWGPNGPVSTGKVLPEGAEVKENPYQKDLRQQMFDVEKEERAYGRQLDMKDLEHDYSMEREVFQERGRNARHSPSVKTRLWANPETGEYRHLSEEDVNSGKYQGWQPYNPRKSGSSWMDEDEGTGPKQQGKPELTRDEARAKLRELGIDFKE